MFGVETATWAFVGLFPPNERTRVQTILEDGGLYDVLRTEYPEPLFQPSADDDSEGGEVTEAWDEETITVSRPQVKV
jgi:hypothetical protein